MDHCFIHPRVWDWDHVCFCTVSLHDKHLPASALSDFEQVSAFCNELKDNGEPEPGAFVFNFAISLFQKSTSDEIQAITDFERLISGVKKWL